MNIDRVYKRYDTWRQHGFERGTVYWARHDLEVARHVLDGRGGIDGSGATCSSTDRGTLEWKKLNSQLKTAEQRVEELEEERGVRFEGIRQATLIWSYRDSGERVPQNVANNL